MSRMHRLKVFITEWSWCCSLLFLLVPTRAAVGNVALDCGPEEVSTAYLNIAADMITKTKNYLARTTSASNFSGRPVDCEEVLSTNNRSGVYWVWPRNRVRGDNNPLNVYCDMDTDGGGWLVLQRRGNFNRSKDYFYKTWASYKNGFGDIEKDFWLGNDNIFSLTNQRLYSIRFDLEAVDGETRYALYDMFWIDDENNKYALHIEDYSGNAGDSMMAKHNNAKFSTRDQDNNDHDSNCAQTYKGGWWYGACHDSNLNGLYLYGQHESYADGVNWRSWRGYNESMAITEIKIRPKGFRRKPTLDDDTPMSHF